MNNIFNNTYATSYAPSTSQMDMFNRLLGQKNVNVGDTVTVNDKSYVIPSPVGLSKSDMTGYIGILQMARPVRAMTINQEQIIADNCFKMSMKVPDMTGWTTDKASTFINALFARAKELRLQEPASEMQMQRIATMFDMGIINALPTELTRKDASDLIESLSPAYDAWLREHATISQIISIQSLQRKLNGYSAVANDILQRELFRDKQIEDGEADPVKIAKQNEAINNLKAEVAKVVTEQYVLRNLTRDGASHMIEELNAELRNRDNIINARTIFSPDTRSADTRDINDEKKGYKNYFADKNFEHKTSALIRLRTALNMNDRLDTDLDDTKIGKLLDETIAMAKFYMSEEEIAVLVEEPVLAKLAPKATRRSRTA